MARRLDRSDRCLLSSQHSTDHVGWGDGDFHVRLEVVSSGRRASMPDWWWWEKEAVPGRQHLAYSQTF